MEKTWKIGDVAVVLNDERTRALLKGEICDITTDYGVPYYHIRKNGDLYGEFDAIDMVTPEEYQAILKEQWEIQTISMVRCDDGAIWVTSDHDQNGTESRFEEIKDEKLQYLIALAEFFGYEPSELFNF